MMAAALLSLAAVTLLLALVGLAGLVRAWQAARVVRRLTALPLVPVEHLTDLAHAVEGQLRAETPARCLDGRPCALVMVTVRQLGRELSAVTRGAGLSLDDASGSCRLDDSGPIAVAGPATELTLTVAQLSERGPPYEALAARLPTSTLPVRVTERVIEQGERVLATGHTAIDPAGPSDSYPQGTGSRRMLGARPGAPLVVAAGGRAASVRRALAPAVGLAVVGAGSLATSAALAWLALRR